MPWAFTEIVSTEDDPDNENNSIHTVKYSFTPEESEQEVVFNLPKSNTEEQSQNAFDDFLTNNLQEIEITRFDFSSGITLINGVLSNLNTMLSNINNLFTVNKNNYDFLVNQASIIRTQMATVNSLLDYLNSKIV